jgi:methylglyoxal synthase
MEGKSPAAETIDETASGHTLGARKRIALIAHDNRNADMLAWARFNRDTLAKHELFATGTTGALIYTELNLPVHRFLSGPLGGDQQVGAAIAEGRIDAVMFFWDPLEPHPHDVDVKALLRVAVVHNVAIACNRATADFVLSSPLMNQEYAPSFTKAEEPLLESGAAPAATTA